MLLQPGDLFGNLTIKVVPELVRKSDDKFVIIPFSKYAQTVKAQIDKQKEISKMAKAYLKGLVDFVAKPGSSDKLKKLFDNQGDDLKEETVIKDFGEVLGPLFAIKYCKGSNPEVIFPTRQNYEIYDFFIKTKTQTYGFSSKALKGGSNTLAPKLIVERVQKMKLESKLKKYSTELEVLKCLTQYPMFEGVVMAFASLIKSGYVGKGFNTTSAKLKSMFNGVKFENDAKKLESQKEGKIAKMGLSKPKAYAAFLNNFVLESTKVPDSEKKKLLSGKTSYTSTNVIYGMIKFIASSSFKLDEIMNMCFQDLYIVKMGMKDGVPEFVMQTFIPMKDTVTGNNFAFRSKAGFDRVNDKPGIQL
jgi:hypothetical protein